MAANRLKYGTSHRNVRKQVARVVAAGYATCWRCKRPIHPDERWHLGHDDAGRVHAGPEHERCNLSAGGVVGNERRWGTRTADDPPLRWSRHWSGGFSEACPKCRELGHACPDADTDEENRVWEAVLGATGRSERQRRLAEYTELVRGRRAAPNGAMDHAQSG
jgi:hypothetical protein